MPPHQFWPRYHSDGLSPVHVRFEFFSKQSCNVEALICHFYKNIKTLTQIHFPRDARIFRTCTIFYRHYKGLHQMRKDLVLCAHKILRKQHKTWQHYPKCVITPKILSWKFYMNLIPLLCYIRTVNDCDLFSIWSLGWAWHLFLSLESPVYEELVSKTAHIHSYMLLICSSGHSKEANFQHKIYCKWKKLILIEIWNRRYQQIQILQL